MTALGKVNSMDRLTKISSMKLLPIFENVWGAPEHRLGQVLDKFDVFHLWFD